MAKRGKPKARQANRLAAEKSPYLLQHAANPVDWYPWGEEAFERARREDRPIFLSIGYSTCHWCHVMAHESFEDPQVATLMNGAFVNVKVDREERPDIDAVYMTVCQIMTGSGGWPLTIVMTPDKRPFFAGTYFPRENRFGRMGMRELVPTIERMWRERRPEIVESAAQITSVVTQQARSAPGGELDQRAINTAALELNQRFDEEHGGFGQAPKFPSPHQLTFLLRFWRRADDDWSLEIVKRTLHAIARGGIHDHVGGGFHRYSTDRRWLLPHFEKMLYDQAGLLLAYTEAFQATGDPLFRRTAEGIAAYVLRDLASPEGGFHSAEDADSEGVEGKFYVWTRQELDRILGEEDAELAARVFNVQRKGNFRDEATGEETGANILHMTEDLDELSSGLGMTVETLEDRVESILERLRVAREGRVRPHLDDKVLADWNGFMVVALARAGSVLDRPDLVEAAAKAADFVLGTMRRSDGRLLHRYRDGEAAVQDHLDDYAYLAWGLLELYEATFDPARLETALALVRTMLERFWDGEAGGFFLTPDDGEELLVRTKEVYDGAAPSGNSVAMMVLLRLHHMTGDPDRAQRASELAMTFAGEVVRMPSAFTQLMSALDLATGSAREVVIVGDPQAEDTRAMLTVLRSHYLPSMVVLLKAPGEAGEAIAGLAPFLAEHRQVDGRATAYVCTDRFCRSPTTDPAKMLEQLAGPAVPS